MCDWLVNDEGDVTGYDVERSEDGKIFKVVGSVSLAGLANNSKYNFCDKELPLNSSNLYYRVKIKDADQMFAYTKTVTVSKSKYVDKVTVYPYPFDRTLRVNIGLLSAGDVTAEIIDMSGKVVATQKKYLTAGNNTIHFDALDGLSPGVYFLSVDANGDKEMQKIIKQ